MEVRNITPNYTSNATSFGMAFKRPSADVMGNFTEYVTKKGKNSARLAKRGVAKIVDRHANDKHFNFEYVGDGKFEIVPKSPRAMAMKVDGQLPEDVKAPKGIIERTRAKYFSDAYKAEMDEASGLKAAWMLTKQFAAALKARLTIQFKPVDALPKGIRNTSSKVSAYEKLVEKQIAKEAKETAAAKKAAVQRAKAEEKARNAARKQILAEQKAKQKAIDTIDSVFIDKEKI